MQYNQQSSPFQHPQSSPLQQNQTQQWPLGNSSQQNLSNGSAELNFMRYDNQFQCNPQNVDDQTFFNLLMSATDSQLLQARNPAFTGLLNKVSALEAQLDAQRDLVSTLKGMLQNQPATSVHAQGSASGKLIIPPPPPQSDQTDFEQVNFWTRGEWVKYQTDYEARNRDFKKLGFLTNEDGEVTDDARIKAISEYARQLWNSLRSENQDPQNWGARTSIASEFFSNSMRSKFPEFRLCEGDWKVHAFTMIRYPDYTAQTRKTGPNPKRKAENDAGKASNQKARKPKKQRANKTPPTDTDVIDLADDEPSGVPVATDSGSLMTTADLIPEPKTPPCPRPRPLPMAQASAPATNTGTLAVTPPTATEAPATRGSATDLKTPPRRTPPPDPVTRPTAHISAPATSHPTVTATPATENRTPVTSNDEEASNSVTATLVTNNDETAKNSVTGDSAADQRSLTPPLQENPPSASPIDSKATPSNEESPPPAPIEPAAAISNPTTTDNRGQQEDDLFRNLSIPLPCEEAPFTAALPTASTLETTKPRKAKAMEPSKAFTGHNFFAIDYLKNHPDTTAAEFKKVYDSLDQGTRDKYDALAKEKKKEEGVIKRATCRGDAGK